MLVVDFDAPDRLRAFARFERPASPRRRRALDLLGHGHLALTIDQGSDGALSGHRRARGPGARAAAHQYFRQSEQIPTFVRLAVAESMTGAGTSWRAGGLMVQFLPASVAAAASGRSRSGRRAGRRTCRRRGGRRLGGGQALAATVEDHELVDPDLSSERLLYPAVSRARRQGLPAAGRSRGLPLLG